MSKRAGTYGFFHKAVHTVAHESFSAVSRSMQTLAIILVLGMYLRPILACIFEFNALPFLLYSVVPGKM